MFIVLRSYEILVKSGRIMKRGDNYGEKELQ